VNSLYIPLHVLGHCGYVGVGGVVLVITAGQAVLIAGSIGLIGSFYSAASSLTALAAPYIFDGLSVVSWATGAASVLCGSLLLLTSSSKLRKPLFNVWIAAILLYTIAIFVYGINMVNKMRNLYLIADNILASISETALDAVGASEKVRQKMSPGGGVYKLAQQATEGLYLKYAPYPLNFLFFMGMRPDVAALIFVALPAMFNLFALPFCVTIRNYFTTDKSGVVKHREVYEGVPLNFFICTGVPGKESSSSVDAFAEVEEDLASTFDGSSDEDDSLDDDESPLLSASITGSDDDYDRLIPANDRRHHHN
jgi:hypothetical protein